MEPVMYHVPADLMQALHDYLTGRPMREVEGLVSAIRQCQPAAPKASRATDEPSV